jgi:hypothetical protein
MNLASKEFVTLTQRSAELRGRCDFAGAIALIESKKVELEPDCLVNAYLECFYAAREAGMKNKATEYATSCRLRSGDSNCQGIPRALNSVPTSQPWKEAPRELFVYFIPVFEDVVLTP